MKPGAPVKNAAGLAISPSSAGTSSPLKEDDVLQSIMEKENNGNNNNRNPKYVGTDRARSLKSAVAPASGESSDEDEEESESDVTVSDEDSEIERIIAARFGKMHGKNKDIHKEKYRVSKV